MASQCSFFVWIEFKVSLLDSAKSVKSPLDTLKITMGYVPSRGLRLLLQSPVCHFFFSKLGNLPLPAQFPKSWVCFSRTYEILWFKTPSPVTGLTVVAVRRQSSCESSWRTLHSEFCCLDGEILGHRLTDSHSLLGWERWLSDLKKSSFSDEALTFSFSKTVLCEDSVHDIGVYPDRVS